jgi:hypothetical protein
MTMMSELLRRGFKSWQLDHMIVIPIVQKITYFCVCSHYNDSQLVLIKGLKSFSEAQKVKKTSP